MDVIPHRSEWLRGVLELCVLRVLSGGATYGYAIAAELARAGFGDIKGGTLYPLLGRLEKNALVTAEWRAGESGPGRKYFALTDAGRLELDDGIAQWDAFARTVGAHLSRESADRASPASTESSHPTLEENRERHT